MRPKAPFHQIWTFGPQLSELEVTNCKQSCNWSFCFAYICKCKCKCCLVIGFIAVSSAEYFLYYFLSLPRLDIQELQYSGSGVVKVSQLVVV